MTTNVGSPTLDCPLKKKPEKQDPKKHWIKFKVVDTDNNPLKKVVLRITLPDGSSVEKTTDKNGMIEINNIEAGNCKLETDWKGHTVYDTLHVK
jgi:hypothetical protein